MLARTRSGPPVVIYALAGYDPTKQEVIEAFKFFVREEAREYEREFPNQLYDEWYRLYELPRPGKNKPWKFKHLTVEQVYMPLARSNGKILQLTRAQRARGERWAKERGWTQERLAEEAGMNWLQVGHVERGASDPKLSTIVKLAKALRVPAAELLRRGDS